MSYSPRSTPTLLVQVAVCYAIGCFLKPSFKGQRETHLVVEKKEKPIKFSMSVVQVVGVLGLLGVHMPVEDVNFKKVEVLTADYRYEQRTILYKDNITRAERGAIVRQG